MEFFCAALTLTTTAEGTWETQKGDVSFPFPDIYLYEDAAKLRQTDADFAPFLQDCLRRFTCRDYGNIISMDQVENFLSRDITGENTWMQAIYPTARWGNVHLEIFQTLALFHLQDTAPKDVVLAQRGRTN